MVPARYVIPQRDPRSQHESSFRAAQGQQGPSRGVGDRVADGILASPVRRDVERGTMGITWSLPGEQGFMMIRCSTGAPRPVSPPGDLPAYLPEPHPSGHKKPTVRFESPGVTHCG
jgi:hypothetical protein